MSDSDSEGKPPWWIDILKTFGIPTAALFALLWMIWQAGAWAGTTVIMPLFDKQIKFIDRATEMTQEMTDTTKSIQRTLDAHGDNMEETLKLATQSQKEMIEVKGKVEINVEGIKNNGVLFQKSNEEVVGILKEIAENTKPKPPKP